ncbi:copper homeostasis periplasmic binding protein CopC [Phenylobacterium soli]|uniref:Copper resistance protein CopC n=1 Tax=Phenylobacterium soli TaxID=2170551 RepID=A0A328AL71_9CAUL|nr:copper homeostasis periplasmic binding protein CopC [Phenylobacterium soli]RAK54154.1 copper resistance protein CopC [Phenylobacterium soli]
MTKFHLAAATAAIALLTAAQAQAHAKLVSAIPADGATVAAPKQIVLKFSEKLQPKFSTAHLMMPAMNNMAMPVKATVAKDGVTMIVTPKGALSTGAYTVHWQAVAADTHKMEGKVNFTVR